MTSPAISCNQAHAAITIGKDTTWRDYAQGAFRMRGILTGQSVEVILTPEVSQLVQRDLAKIARAAALQPVVARAWAAPMPPAGGEGEEVAPPPISAQMSVVSPNKEP